MSNDIKNIVLGLMESYNSNDPFDLCKSLGMCLFIHDLGEELLGFFQRTPNGTEILHISSRLNYHMQKYICCHELGHAILQPELAISFFIENPLVIQNKFEIEADTFAAELLLEDDILKNYEGFTIEQIAAAENVPKKLVELKFRDLSLF